MLQIFLFVYASDDGVHLSVCFLLSDFKIMFIISVALAEFVDQVHIKFKFF